MIVTSNLNTKYYPHLSVWCTLLFYGLGILKHSIAFLIQLQEMSVIKNMFLSLSVSACTSFAHINVSQASKVSNVSTIHIYVINKGISNASRHRFLNMDTVKSHKIGTYNSFVEWSWFMDLLGDWECFVKSSKWWHWKRDWFPLYLSVWYIEHYKACNLETSKNLLHYLHMQYLEKIFATIWIFSWQHFNLCLNFRF